MKFARGTAQSTQTKNDFDMFVSHIGPSGSRTLDIFNIAIRSATEFDYKSILITAFDLHYFSTSLKS